MSKDILSDEFQYTVTELLIRNKGILDSLTKFQESNSRVNRAIVKSATQCGCIKINANKQPFSEENGSFDTIKETMSTQVKGKLCENCRDTIEKEMGRNLFYLTSLCNVLDLNVYDILIKELDQVKTLGKYNLR
ncbi:MAG: DUF1573 domain-containing protein [Eubacteriales bacterium]|nr:DUF1573 domain-containing protein [Eubacteriales bacterium]